MKRSPAGLLPNSVMRGDGLPVVERIQRTLIALRMPRALELLDHAVRQLERGEASALELIDTLFAEELSVRESHRIKTALMMASLSTIKTLDSFDFSFQPSLDRERIFALAELQFVDRREVVHFLGPPGPGKSRRQGFWSSARRVRMSSAASFDRAVGFAETSYRATSWKTAAPLPGSRPPPRASTSASSSPASRPDRRNIFTRRYGAPGQGENLIKLPRPSSRPTVPVAAARWPTRCG